jgi:hypothetical protein
MDQNDPANIPPPPADENSSFKNAAGNIDLGKILLPKKETPGQTPQSAQRVNAAALLEQEVVAAQEGIPKAPQTVPAPPSAPEPKKETPTVAPLETYKSDIERVVQEKNISMVSIAAAEAVRRGSAAESETVGDAAGEKRSRLTTWLMVAGGMIFIVAASGALAWAVYRPAPAAQAPQAPASTLISTDGTQTIVMPPGEKRDALMTDLEAAREQTALSLGLISRLWVAEPTTTTQGNTLEDVPPQTLLSTLAPDAPPELVRAIEPDYLLGVHVYDGNQALLIFKVDSYEQAYAGMLAWEPAMHSDLLPLFQYTPPQHIPEENAASSSPTAGPPQLTGQSGFVDRVVENHDARVIQNQYGDISLLWTFLDKSTLVITTTDATLREIISRIQNAPVVPQP